METRQSILATLAYHDIFDYPLKAEEVHRFLIDKKVDKSQVATQLNKLTSKSTIGQKQGFYYLKNRSTLVKTRLAREKHSEKKFKRALFYASLLKIIPTIKLAAVSGALAMENSNKNDDIDIIIIASRGYLWTTRFFANLILWPFKRDPRGKHLSNKACLNLFLDEKALKIKDQNLYTAHEICQIKPILDRDNTYQKFIRANLWIKKYLPNWKPEIVNSKSKIVNRKGKKAIYLPFTINNSPTENILKSFQLSYMRSKISTERIWDKQLFFHPANTQEKVLSEYRKRLKKLNLTT